MALWSQCVHTAVAHVWGLDHKCYHLTSAYMQCDGWNLLLGSDMSYLHIVHGRCVCEAANYNLLAIIS